MSGTLSLQCEALLEVGVAVKGVQVVSNGVVAEDVVLLSSREQHQHAEVSWPMHGGVILHICICAYAKCYSST